MMQEWFNAIKPVKVSDFRAMLNSKNIYIGNLSLNFAKLSGLDCRIHMSIIYDYETKSI